MSTVVMGSVAELHFQAIKKLYPESELHALPDGSWLVRVHGIELPSGWNQSTSSVSFIVPVGYPASRPDCFFADATLRLANGGMPGSSGIQQVQHTGMQQLWFSWHVASWNPSRDSLLTYVRVIRDRLSRAN